MPKARAISSFSDTDLVGVAEHAITYYGAIIHERRKYHTLGEAWESRRAIALAKRLRRVGYAVITRRVGPHDPRRYVFVCRGRLAQHRHEQGKRS